MIKLISLKKDSNIKVDPQISYFLNPDFVYIPKNAKILIQQNEKVTKEEFVTADLASPISGTAIGIKTMQEENINKKCLVIANDFRELSKNKKVKKRKITLNNIMDILIKNNEEKLLKKLQNQNKFDNIIISAINDEPYIFNNIYILKENIADLLSIIDELSMLYKSNNNYLIVKNNEANIINDCLNSIGTYPNIKLTLVNDEYLLEKEEFILKKLQIINEKNLYLDVNDLDMLCNYLLGKDNSTKLITISGDAILESKVIRTKKNVLLSDIIKKYIKIIDAKYDVIFNGLMSGCIIKDVDNFVITNNINSINIMKKKTFKVVDCINCGKCIEICPKNLNPLNKHNLEKCINCGLCSYVCPCYINLKKEVKINE